jgi:glucosamine-6-phosphate deaminase
MLNLSPTDTRKTEIRMLLGLSTKDVIDRAGTKLRVCRDLDHLHRTFAEDLAEEIRTRNAQNLPTRLILPVGPVGQYTFFAKIVNFEKISLKNCWFFFMDEYCDDNVKAVPMTHPLSFQRIIYEKFVNALDDIEVINPYHIIFPNENNIQTLDQLIETVGGIDTCYGGIGIHGHIAFNEPAKEINQIGSRKVPLNDITVTINAIRAQVGGNLECFPRSAFTIGMRQILAARRIRLFCRNGTPFDWANTILRIALLGAVCDDYPVTYIRDHPDYLITTDEDTLFSPKNQI